METGYKGIYGIYSSDDELLYVGMTQKDFIQRWEQHWDAAAYTSDKENSQQWYLYKRMRQEWREGKDIKLVMIKAFKKDDYISKAQLEAMEMVYIETLKPKYNYVGSKVPYKMTSGAEPITEGLPPFYSAHPPKQITTEVI